MSKGKRSTSVVATLAVMAALLVPMALASSASAVGAPSSDFKICRGDVTAADYLANPYGSGFICAEAHPSNYSGNAGKGWNELDLVPFRLILTTGGNEAQTYPFGVAVDFKKNNIPGYDFITVPTVNVALSTGTCSNLTNLVGGPGDPDNDGLRLRSPGFTNGTDSSLFRLETINLGNNATCVIDFDARLAVGAHLFPGASLHGNITDGNANGTNQDRSISVNEIAPQEVNKDMTAVRDVDHTWNIIKGATPSDIDLGDTCATPNPQDSSVEITVTWTRGPATAAGMTHITANIYATNPAHRSITINATDRVYEGVAGLPGQVPPGQLIHTSAPFVFDVPAGQTVPIGTDEFDTNSTADTFTDQVTATYTDTDLNIPVPGQTSVTVTEEVQVGNELNSSAVITDVESITGSGLSFSVDAVSDATGSFDGGYSLGDKVPASTDLTWTSESKSDSGSVTFNKTVYLAGTGIVSGTLDDTASFATNGTPPVTGEATGSINITSSLTGTLVINKTTTVPVDEDTTFEFTVTPGDIVVPVTILKGESSGSSDVLSGLAAGAYNVAETDSGLFTPAADQQFNIGAGEGEVCAAELDFENTFGPASLQVFKATSPPGAEAGWDFTVTKDGNAFATGTSDATGTVIWNPNPPGTDTLVISEEGHYVVTETGGPPGYDASSQGDCDFTVDFPTDADRPFVCNFTNTRQTGVIIVDKVTDPTNSPQSFDFVTSYAPGGFALKDADAPNNSGPLPTAVYSVAEIPVSGWDLDLTKTECVSSEGGTEDPAAIDLTSNETVTCTFYNTQQGTIIVQKDTEPANSTATFTYTGDAAGTIDNTQEIKVEGLKPGQYKSTESAKTGWALKSIVCDDANSTGTGSTATFNLEAGETVTCVFTNTEQGHARVIKTFNGGVPPAGSSYTFTLRSGASQGVGGSTLETLILNSGNNFTGTFTTLLVPGDSYQLCEENVPVGGHSDLSDLPGAFSPGQSPADNSTQCAPFTVAAGETKTFTVNNTPPPGGDTRTIGYWKNWASCAGSNGKQAPKLDQTLFAAGVNGISIGDLVLHGGLTANVSPDCAKAVNILNKSTIDGKKKMASDPAFNLAAQLLAAKLNVVAGAGSCQAATDAIAQAQALLDLVNFDGTKAPTMTTAQKTQANTLAATLDKYNNGDLCP